ncbi:MAG: NAD(P)/FAD-dependent oxidoreductase [Ginsengibacter sp.]
MSKQTLVVVGGGAAGFFCAIHAAIESPSLKVIIVEKSNKLLSKVRISGGGRCNVTHDCNSVSEMVKKYPRGGNFLKKSFQHFFTNDTVNWFEQRGVKIKAEADGRMFPISDSSQSIIDCMMNEVIKYKIEIILNRDIKSILNKNKGWLLYDQCGSELYAEFLCIAAGGHHKISQFDWLTNLKHELVAPVPSLFTFNVHQHPLKHLMGVSLSLAVVKIKGTNFIQEGPLLVTHWGFSGPAVLKLSAYAAIELNKMQYDFLVVINWLPAFNETSLHEKLKMLKQNLSQQKIKNKNIFNLPQRLWENLVTEAGIHVENRWDQIPLKALNLLGKILCSSEYRILGKTTFKEEFVTAGGISLQEIDADTMQSKLCPNLFFAGEIMNVDGITGGFNFQHAWTSGYIAGKSIGMKANKLFN